MGETGKRSRHEREANSDAKNQRRKQDNSSDGQLVVYRILCPNNLIGSVIGKGGKVINSIRQETQAKIKVVDPFPGADKRVITIYCHVSEIDANAKDITTDEDNTNPLCSAQDALLKVHATIANATGKSDDSDEEQKEEANILAPSSQAANIIGKAGATIKRLRSKTHANIKVDPKDPKDATHSCAMSFDNFVQITGDVRAVKRALFAVSAIMYKFPPKEEISLDTNVPELPPTIIIPSDVPIYPHGSFYPVADVSGSVAPIVGAAPHVPELHGYSDAGSGWPMYSSALPVVSGYGGGSSRSEELVFRVLCPSDKIGRVIGKGGGTIKNIRKNSGASLAVDDTKDPAEECIITVTSLESHEDVKSAAVEAVLLLQEKINDEVDDTVSVRLLVPTKAIGCLIGKNGSIINEMRKNTKADIRISKGEKPKRASSSDELLEVFGEAANLRDALVQIIIRLRDYVLRDRDGGSARNAPPVDPVYSNTLPAPSVYPNVQPVVNPYSYDQRVEPERGLGLHSSSSLYGYSSLQAGDDGGYGSISSYGGSQAYGGGSQAYGAASQAYGAASQAYGGLLPYNEVLIPANAVARVMGSGGANLTNIQKLTGARVEIVESKTSRSERIAQISGTSTQKREAENMIQVFIMAS